MLTIVDWWIVGVSVLVHCDDLSIDLVKAEAKLSPSATSANEIISECAKTQKLYATNKIKKNKI